MIHYEHYRGNEAFVKRIYDLIELVERRKRTIITPFFSPDQSALIERIIGKQLYYVKDGGYEGAERVRFAICPYEEDTNVNIIALKATYSSSFAKIEHRDVLGALLNLGLEREKFGDILVKEDEVIIFVDQDIENYIVCNLVKIKRASVHFKPYEGEVVYTPKIVYEHKIVSSLRLDVVVAALANLSRKNAQLYIKSGFVKVNHVVLEDCSSLCDNNYVISIRRHGRFHFLEVEKKTKKEHYVISVGKYE